MNKPVFLDQVSHQLDTQSRWRIPSKYAELLGKNPYIMKGKGGILVVYRNEDAYDMLAKTYADVEEGMDSQNFKLRQLTASSQYANEDEQGRVSIKKELLDYAGIIKNIVTVGAYTRLEIWAEDKYKEYMSGGDKA